jgi:DNA primase
MNGFVPNYIEEIKRRLSLVDYISTRTALKKSGKNYKGLCPFHNEKSGSFFVFPQSETYYCFGCHATGDIFTFAMKTEGLEFAETLELLAKRANVTLPEREKTAPDPQAEAQQVLKERLREINAAAATYFNHLLLKAGEAQAARAYLEKRGLDRQTIESFGLGYALDSWDALLKHLTAGNRFSITDLVAAGLVGERDNGEGYFDRFRGRVIFPIRDRQGQIIAFGGRVLEGAPKDAPKYLNSPQTLLFDKSSTLYGFDMAREAIRKQDCAVVVEGYMDVIAAHKAGFANVVAPLGTALNEKHVATLKRLTKRIVLALDADAAGQRATLQGIEVLKKGFDSINVAVPNARGLIQFEQQLDADIRIAVLTGGKDPDEIIRESGEKWQELVARALPVVDYIFNYATTTFDLDSARGKSEAIETLIPVIMEVRDRIAREHYIQKLAERTRIGTDLLYAEIKRAARQEFGRNNKATTGNDVPPADVHINEETEAPPVISIGTRRGLDIEDKLIAFIWRYPTALAVTGLEGRPVSLEDFTRSENRLLFESLVQATQNGLPLPELEEALEPGLLEYLRLLQAHIEEQPELDPYVQITPDMEFQLNRLREARTREVVQVLEEEIGEVASVKEVSVENETVNPAEDRHLWEQAAELANQLKLYYPKPSTVFKDSRDR